MNNQVIETGNELAVIEDSETAMVEFGYVGRPINREIVVEFGDTLMGVHPNSGEIGKLGMRTVAQLALVTGANPLPGTNGIHAWRNKEGALCIQFGIGYWRGKVDAAGGIVWITRPRPMTDRERESYGVTQQQAASICIGALQEDVFRLMDQARDRGFEMRFNDAKNEVARVGYAVVNPKEYDKKGRNKQWSADLRAERDLLRQLVPVLTPDFDRVQHGQGNGGYGWNLRNYTRKHLPESTVDESYSIADANYDFFDGHDDGALVVESVDTETGEIVEAELVEENQPVQEIDQATNSGAPKKLTRPLPPDVLREYIRSRAAEFDNDAPATNADAKQTAMSLGNLVNNNNYDRYDLTEYLFGVRSAKKLTVGQVAAIRKWVGMWKDPNGDWHPNADAMKEAQSALVEARIELGQTELFADEEE